MRAKSAQPKQNFNQIEILEQQLNHQVKKASLLDDDRKQFWKQAEDTKFKNKQWIQKLKSENKKLKETRDDLMNNKKLFNRTSSFSNFSNEIKDQNFWRRQLDKQKDISKTKKKKLLSIQDMLKQVEDTKTGYIEQNPLMKTIRILENRLDKVMIKYNEAQSIKKTYQQIVKRLKQERVGYDNQLAAIQTSLKGKQHDFEQLLLLAHDATHAKQLAHMQLKKYENKKASIQQLRSKYLEQKKSNIQNKKINRFQQDQKEINKQQEKEKGLVFQNVINYKQEINYQKQQLNDYEDAFRKLKEVTGVLDANEIIQKFKTQNLTAKSFDELKQNYRIKIQKLKKTKLQLRQKLNIAKLYGSETEVILDKKQMNESESNLVKVKSKYEKLKEKNQRIQKVLVNSKAGIEHLSRYLYFIKISDHQAVKIDQNPEIALKQINEKLTKIYKVVKCDPQYEPQNFRQSLPKVEQLLTLNFKELNEEMIIQKNNRIKNFNQEQDEISDNEFEQEITLDNTIKIKPRNLQATKSMDNIKRFSTILTVKKK